MTDLTVYRSVARFVPLVLSVSNGEATRPKKTQDFCRGMPVRRRCS